MAKEIPRIPVEGFERRGVEVVVDRLIKVYRSGRAEVQALRGVSIRFRPSEITCIMGPSGSGKTTLLNMIGGVDRPTAGKVFVDGRNIVELSDRELEFYRLTMVGYVFQTFNLIPSITAIENVELPMALLGVPPKVRRARARWLLKLVGLEGMEDRYPDELSGGEQQRVAIAVALANDPPVIIADEPTAELDAENARIVMDILVKLGREIGKTVIVSTHDPRVAIRADRIVRLVDGTIVGEHTPIDLEQGVQMPSPSLREIIKTKIAQLEREIEVLSSSFRSGEIDVKSFVNRVSRIYHLIEALKELGASIGEHV